MIKVGNFVFPCISNLIRKGILLNDISHVYSSPQARFFCLQVLEDVLRFRSSSVINNQVRSSLWKWLQVEYKSISEPIFIKNKLAVVIILLFKSEYLKTWTSFFDDVLNLCFHSKPWDLNMIDLFLRICISLDEEIINHGSTSVSKDMMDHYTLIKDQMRISDTKKLTDAWMSILSNFADDPNQIALSQVCFRLFGLYVSWVDIYLVVNDNFLAILYPSLKKSCTRVSACECLCEILSKGMKSTDKLSLIHGLNVIDMIPSMSDPQLQMNEESDLALSKLVNVIGLEICICLESNTPECIPIGSDLLNRLFPFLLKYLSHSQEDVWHALLSFLSSLLSNLKRLKKSCEILDSKSIISLLQVIVMKMRYADDEDFDLSQDDSLFIQYRKVY